MDSSPNLNLPYLMAAQAQKHVTHNEAIRDLDALVHLSVLDRDLTAPPGSPSNGDRYLVGSGATDAWVGKDGDITAYQDGNWVFHTPGKGWVCWIEDEETLQAYNGASWGRVVGSSLQNLSMHGINTTADGTNRLAVRAPSALFDAEMDDINLTLNKVADTDDARLTFQTGFSTRALFGTLGNDDFGISVSPDGSTFNSAISIDKDTGNVGLGGATADASNGLIAKGASFLFDQSGDHCRFTFNKNTDGDDVALVFQSGYSARALIGLLGNNDFTFKVTPDGASFHTAMIVDKDDGMVAMPAHSKFSATSNFDNYVAANSWTKINFNSTNHNDQNDFDAANARFTAPADGVYSVGALINFKENGTVPAFIAVRFHVGGAAVADTEQRYSGAIVTLETGLNTHAMLKLSSGDHIDVHVYFGTNDGYIEANTCAFWGAKIA